MMREFLGGRYPCCFFAAMFVLFGPWCPETLAQQDAEVVSEEAIGMAEPGTGMAEPANVDGYPATRIPILPEANEQAYRREVTTLALMGVMALVCTFLAFFAVWMLQRNSKSTLGANASVPVASQEDD